MKHIIINNLGPLRHAEVDLEKFNVVIGPKAQAKAASCSMTRPLKLSSISQSSANDYGILNHPYNADIKHKFLIEKER